MRPIALAGSPLRAKHNGPAEPLLPAAQKAKKLGAGGFMVCPGLAGMDAVRLIAADDSARAAHNGAPGIPGKLCHIGAERLHSFDPFWPAHAALRRRRDDLPQLGRTRFSFTREQCRQIADASREDMGGLKTILPAPGGGMTADRAKDIRAVYPFRLHSSL